MTIHLRHSAAAALVLATALSGCSGSSKNHNASATATQAPAAAAPSSTRPAGAPSPRPAQPLPTLAPADPALTALVQKLTPLLLQAADLPSSFTAFQPVGVFPISNADYSRGQPNAADIQARLEKDGRLGGAQTGWSLSGQYQRGQKVVTTLSDNLSEFGTADGAKDGLALVFSQITASGTTPQGDPFNTRPLDIGRFGDESQAYRVEQMMNVNVPGSPTPGVDRVSQVIYVAAVRRGNAVAIVNISALNLDPPIDDLQRLMNAQDQRLKNAGY